MKPLLQKSPRKFPNRIDAKQNLECEHLIKIFRAFDFVWKSPGGSLPWPGIKTPWLRPLMPVKRHSLRALAYKLYSLDSRVIPK